MVLTKSVQFLLLEAQEEDVLRVHPLRVECKYTVRGQGIITFMQPRLVAGGEGVVGEEVICHKKVQSFLNQSLDPPIKNSWIRPCC